MNAGKIGARSSGLQGLAISLTTTGKIGARSSVLQGLAISLTTTGKIGITDDA
jgi:hypothetical protein